MHSLALNDITKRYAVGSVLDSISFTINPGERVALVGESGSGKTTLLRIIAGLESPSAGKIKVDEADITTWAANRRGIGMVFQDYATYPRLSVAENLTVSLVGAGLNRADKDARLAELANWLGLEGLLKRLPAELSGGQVQRVALGKALMARPKILLLDEPFSQLDVRLVEQMRQLLADAHARYGMTQLIVTHHPLDALCSVDKLAVLHQGKLIHFDTPSQVRLHPQTLFAAELTSPCGLNVLPALAIPASGAPTGATLAIRPEALHCACDQPPTAASGVLSWKCRLGKVSDLGIVRLREASFGGYRLSMLASPKIASAPADQEVDVWVDRSDVMTFSS